jgi:hypothetical protein
MHENLFFYCKVSLYQKVFTHGTIDYVFFLVFSPGLIFTI